MDATRWDPSVKRFRWLQIGCVCAIMFRLLVLIVKWIVMYVRFEELDPRVLVYHPDINRW